MIKNFSEKIVKAATILFFMLFVFLMLFLAASIYILENSDNFTPLHASKTKQRDESKLLMVCRIDRDRFRDINMHIVKKEIGKFYQTRGIQPIKDYVKSKGYRFIIEPSLDNYHTHKNKKIHTLARIVIESRYMQNKLWCLAQEEYNGNPMNIGSFKKQTHMGVTYIETVYS